MAETQKTYKYIDADLDSNLLLTNLKHNAQKYVQFKKWDESKAREFYSALTEFEKAIEEGRLSSDQSGDIIDSGGLLTNGSADWRDKDGNVLSQEQYDALNNRNKKKATKDFYANREVASYLGVIAKDIYNKKNKKDSKPAEGSTKFDFSKHGLWGKFVTSMAPNGTGDLEAWLDSDPFDEKTKKRGTTQRAQLFSDYINQYISGLSDDLDFSDTSFGTRENYLQRLEALKTELATNGVTDADYRIINQLGGNPEEYRAFFTTDKQYVPASAASAAAQQQAATAQEIETETTRARLNQLDSQYREAYTNSRPTTYRAASAPTGVKYDTKAADKITAYQNALNAANVDFSPTSLQQTDGRAYLDYLEQYGTMNPGAVQRVDVGTYAGWYYLPGSLNKNNFSVLGYNPNTHQVRRLYYGLLGPQARQEYANILREIDSWNQTANKPVFQQGGAILGYASGLDALAAFDSAQKGLSEKTKADPKNRQPWKEENNYSSTEFTGNDIARLGAIAADIAALIDPEPFSAAGLGLASDITNLVADINEGEGFWNTTGNFLGNVALSAIGIIPVFGDALGSGTKVVKSLVKLAPKVSKYLMGAGVLATVANGDEIIKSFSKIGKDGPENEMNMQDWRNIGVGIQLILGGANAAKNVKASKKATAAKAASETGHVDVRVRDGASGQEKTLRFGGKKDVETLKAAKTPDEVNAVINSHPSMKDKYSVVTDTETGHTWLGAGSTWYKPWSWRQKTSTDILTGQSVSPVYSAKKFHANYTANPHSRDRYLGNSVTRGNTPDEFIKYDFNPNATTRAERGKARLDALRKRTKNQGTPAQPQPTPAQPTPPTPTPKPQPGANKGQGYSGPGKKPQKTPEYKKMQENTLIQRAKDYKRKLQGWNANSPNSPEFKELERRGWDPDDLRLLGIWKQGGALRLIYKGEGGLNTLKLTIPEFTFGYQKPALTVPGFTMPEFKTPSLPFGVGRDPLKYKYTPNYGTGYTSSRNYDNGEYGTTEKVDLSAIRTANAGRRDKALHPLHLAEGYDYSDAQANTNRARQQWQSDANNRTADFMSWAKSWRQANPNGTQADMLAAYNSLIDQMYDYKREMATSDYTGKNSYRKGDAVSRFNQTNKAVYGSANSASGVHGYSVPQENVNGTTTAQRFIDITDDDVLDLNFTFDENAPDEFKNLFTGLVKDKTGRYYVNDKSIVLPEWKMPEFDLSQIRLQPTTTTQPQTDPQSVVNPAGGGGEPEGDTKGRNKPKVNIAGVIAEVLPNALAVGRYLAARQHNKEQYEIAKQMPVMLYDPMEAHKWMFGNEQAVMAGRRAAGRLNHLASQPVTADGNQQQAAQMEGYIRGVDYITQGEAQDAANRERTAEAEWQQERKNQESSYTTAMRNRENLFAKRTNVLTALGAKKRADYESLNGLLGQFETAARTHNEELAALRESADRASLQNDISADMEAYGIPATAGDQILMNDLLSGNRELSSLTAEEKATYDRLSSAIQEELNKRIFASKGISYRPFTPKVTSSTVFIPDSYEIEADRQGGKINGDSEKVTIQKLKGRLKRMEVYQRHLESRLNAYERDQDRAQRSASQYIRGQKKKK